MRKLRLAGLGRGFRLPKPQLCSAIGIMTVFWLEAGPAACRALFHWFSVYSFTRPSGSSEYHHHLHAPEILPLLQAVAHFTAVLNGEVLLKTTTSKLLCTFSLTWSRGRPPALLIHSVQYVVSIQRLPFISVPQELMFSDRVWTGLLPYYT